MSGRKTAIVESFISMEHRMMQEFVETTESNLQRESMRFQEMVEDHTRDMSPEQAEEYSEYVNDKYWMLADVIPQLARRSMFLTLYGALEHHLAFLCRFLSHERQISVPSGRLYLATCTKYLRDHLKLSASAFGQALEFVSDAQALRNYVAHAVGQIDKSGRGQAARSFVNSQSTLSLDQHDRVRIAQGFCEEFAASCMQAFRDIFSVL